MQADPYAAAGYAQCREPISNEALRRLRDDGCNPAELSAYSGHEPRDALMRSYGGRWWLQLGQALGLEA